MMYHRAEYLWPLLLFLYEDKLKESNLRLLHYVSDEELLALIELANKDEELSDEVKVLATRALLARDTKDARMLIRGVIPH